MKKIKIAGIVIIALLIIAGGLWFFNPQQKRSGYFYYRRPKRGNISKTVITTGTVQPVNTVSVDRKYRALL